jgi:hypothetical protein
MRSPSIAAFARVSIVHPGSPAATAGLRVDDELVQFGHLSLASNVRPVRQVLSPLLLSPLSLSPPLSPPRCLSHCRRNAHRFLYVLRSGHEERGAAWLL